MQSLLTPETFEFFARYVLSGFIVISVRSQFVFGPRPKPTEVLFEAVILSLVCQLALLVIGPAAQWANEGTAAWQPSPQIRLLLEILLLPAAIGVLAGLNLSRGWNNAFLRRLSMPVESPPRRAYDAAFSQRPAPSLVILTFEDGAIVYGYFGRASIAASDAD